MNILENIKRIRVDKKITQSDISERLGLAQNNYGNIERGITELTITRLYEIAKILEVSVNELLGEQVTVGDEKKIKELEKALLTYEKLYSQGKELNKIKDEIIRRFNVYFRDYFDLKLSNIMGKLGIFLFVSRKEAIDNIEDYIKKISDEDLEKIFTELIKDNQIEYILSFNIIEDERLMKKFHLWTKNNSFRFGGLKEDIIRYID